MWKALSAVSAWIEVIEHPPFFFRTFLKLALSRCAPAGEFQEGAEINGENNQI
jgi:hypothetical protein